MNGEIFEKSPLEIERDTIEMMFMGHLNMDAIAVPQHDEMSRFRPDGPFQRDFARIMYSSSFRRLQGKMQLLGIKNDQFFRNRLTHSLEVAQIARSIAGALPYGARTTYVVEAGALAHDLGNPPFGHAGERVLNEAFLDVGGFEGNAQTLRILTSIEKKRPEFMGLNLTYRTMFSVVKYFKKFDAKLAGKNKNASQKFIYDEDYDMLNDFIGTYNIKVRTLDVQVVDIADEIAYAAHDLEDGLRVKAYTIDEILHDYKSKYGDGDCYQALVGVVEESKIKAGYGNGKIESTQYSKLFRQELASSIINLALNDIGLIDVTDEMREKTGTMQKKELGFLHYAELIRGLKDIVFKCINHNDQVYHYEQAGEKVIRFLKDFYIHDKMYLPPEYRVRELMKEHEELKGRDEKKLQKRLICDYIAGMMDSYAIAVYEKYSGRKFERIPVLDVEKRPPRRIYLLCRGLK